MVPAIIAESRVHMSIVWGETTRFLISRFDHVDLLRAKTEG
jgi:hypothetical protein